ncbi:unnamed protein product [Coregonus sp. 'balchen']|nr:unnamed protein product [Coregonus sp. 'balchen']
MVELPPLFSNFAILLSLSAPPPGLQPGPRPPAQPPARPPARPPAPSPAPGLQPGTQPGPRPPARNPARPPARPPAPSPSYPTSVPRVLRPGAPITLSVTIFTIAVEVQVVTEIVNGNNTVVSDATIIQGDKANYDRSWKVGQCPFTQPYKSKIDIIIKDPKANMIRQWLSLDSVLGVVSKEFQLSENPPLGKLTILTSINLKISTYNKRPLTQEDQGKTVTISKTQDRQSM